MGGVLFELRFSHGGSLDHDLYVSAVFLRIRVFYLILRGTFLHILRFPYLLRGLGGVLFELRFSHGGSLDHDLYVAAVFLRICVFYLILRGTFLHILRLPYLLLEGNAARLLV